MEYTNVKWWFTPHGTGRRIGWLTPTMFLEQVEELSGEDVLQTRAPLIRLSLWLGVGKSTVYRWADGTDPIPKWVALLLKASLQLQEGGAAFPVNVEADWLPYTGGANGRQRPATPLTGVETKYDGTTHAERQEAAARDYMRITRPPA